MTLASSDGAPNVPMLGGTYSVPPGVISETLRHLQSYRATEAVCFWLTSRNSRTVAEVWRPRFSATAVSYDIEPTEMLRLKAHLDESGFVFIAQVHSHPGMAFHSGTDDQHAASPWPGFLSIVVPNGGRIGNDFWDASEVYERQPGGGWRHVAAMERRKRFSPEEK